MKANYLEGEDALLAEALHEMEKCERDLAEAEKVYEEDVSGGFTQFIGRRQGERADGESV